MKPIRNYCWIILGFVILISCNRQSPGYCNEGKLILSDGKSLLILTPSGDQIKTIPFDGYGISASPDGRSIAFANSGANSSGLFALNIENGVSTKILDWPRDEFHPIWSPNGQEIAFAYGVYDGDLTTYVVNLHDTSLIRQISSNNTGGEIQESPSGWFDDAIVIIKGVPFRGTELILARPDGSNKRIIYTSTNRENFEYFQANISPDGQTVILEKGSPLRISLLSPDSLKETQVNEVPNGSHSASWSPDGKCIAYLYDKGAYVFSFQTHKVTSLPITELKYGYEELIWMADATSK